jgi:hypothetical protein
MYNSTTDPSGATLETVRQHFEAWRSGRTNKCQPIPEQLWQAAASLCENYSISHVCRHLRLSFSELKRRVSSAKVRPAQFMELDMGCVTGGWQLQCDRADGARLRVSGNGQVPALDSLLREFLS